MKEMKKPLILKLVLLALLSYMAILPASSSACGNEKCEFSDDGWLLCVDWGGGGYTQCEHIASEEPEGSGNWVQVCKQSRCS